MPPFWWSSVGGDNGNKRVQHESMQSFTGTSIKKALSDDCLTLFIICTPL